MTLLFGFYYGCMGFCHRAESDLFLFLLARVIYFHKKIEGLGFLILETGISANFDVRRNVVPPCRVRQAHSGSNSPMTS